MSALAKLCFLLRYLNTNAEQSWHIFSVSLACVDVHVPGVQTFLLRQHGRGAHMLRAIMLQRKYEFSL